MKNKFRWVCSWDNGKGGYNPDREVCNCRGRFVKNLKTAVMSGMGHNDTHPWCGWGYAPLGWKNRTTYIEMKTPSGKISTLRNCGDYEKVIEKFDE